MGTYLKGAFVKIGLALALLVADGARSMLSVAWTSSINVPLDHWSYRAIESLAGFGLIDTLVYGTKPFTREEMARLVVEASGKVKGLKPNQKDVAEDIIFRLKKEFEDEVNGLNGEKGLVPPTFVKPIHEASFSFVYVEGKPIEFLPKDQKKGAANIDATEGTPLVRNNEGIRYWDGQNYGLMLSGYANLFNRFSFYVEPYFSLRGDFGETWEGDASLHKAYIKTYLGPVEIEFGRDTLWWGQGNQGSLVFTNNAAPMDMLKFSTPHPVLLPWIFSRIGLIKASTFLSRLESRTEVSYFYLWGGRLNVKPFPWLELGVAGGMQFNGEGVPKLEWGDLLPFIRIQTIGKGGPDKTNQILGFDARITIPFLRNTQIYAEYGGEDSGGTIKPGPQGPEFIVGDNALIAGIFIPRVTDDGKTQFRLEWMQNTFIQDITPGIWYTHWTYLSGWTNDRMIMGHPAGGDSWELFGRLTRDVTPKATVGLDFSHQWRGENLIRYYGFKAQERHYRGGIDLQYFFNDSMELRARLALEKVENFNLIPGEDRMNYVFRTALRYKF